MRKAGVRPGEVKARLIAATEDLIREQGTSAVSLREVARRAGVSHGAPAHYFQNKAGLLSSFAAEGLSQLRQAFSQSIRERDARSGKEVMRALGCAYVHFAISHPGWFDVMVRRDLVDKSTPDFQDATEATYGALRQTVGACVAEGFIDGEEAEEFAVLSWSVVFGLAALWNSRSIEQRMSEVEINRLVERVVDLYIDNIMPAGST
jgi:AcrR family transcriptional regulator